MDTSPHFILYDYGHETEVARRAHIPEDDFDAIYKNIPGKRKTKRTGRFCIISSTHLDAAAAYLRLLGIRSGWTR
jgi:hypothetical protein